MDKKLQNEIIAEFCEWDCDPMIARKWKSRGQWCLAPHDSDTDDMPNLVSKCGIGGLPNYTGDLNAMHDAESYAFSEGGPVEWEFYADNLDTLLGEVAIFATAAQRAEAFLRTIGKWED